MTPLEALIRQEITTTGPMTVARYMELCLTHPEHGYYVTRDPLGTAGDFTTAPEISQMFGEMIGIWVASVWDAMGRPDFKLVEMGPGRGTLMADAVRVLRAAGATPEAPNFPFAHATPAHAVPWSSMRETGRPSSRLRVTSRGATTLVEPANSS